MIFIYQLFENEFAVDIFVGWQTFYVSLPEMMISKTADDPDDDYKHFYLWSQKLSRTYINASHLI